MSESFLESVADVIRTTRMDLGHAKLILSRHVVGKIRDEGAIDVQFEDDDEKDGRNGGDPVQRIEAKLQIDGYNEKM